MKDYGLVSIITPSYNCSRFIDKTIESIQNQTYSNWELLITDDCSTDDSCKIIEKYIKLDSRIKLYRLKKNSGAGIARNNSIKESKGRFIAFCDSDDCWFAEKLEKQLAFLNEKDCGMVYASYLTCEESGRTSGIIICRHQESLYTLRKDDKIGCLTVIYDTYKVGKVYMPNLRKRQDWAMKLKILQKCGMAYGLKEPLAYYRIRENSISRNKRALIKYNIAVYRKIFGWSHIRSILFFTFVFMPTHILKKLGSIYINL